MKIRRLKVKKLYRIMISTIFVLLLMTSAAAASTEQKSVNFDLTCGGEHMVYVKSGDTVKVDLYIENATDDTALEVLKFSDQVYFDHSFFEYLGDDRISFGDADVQGELNVYTTGEHRVYLLAYYDPVTEYTKRQYIGSFELKVTAEQGQSVLMSKDTAIRGVDARYKLVAEDLTVVIGEPPAKEYTVTYMNDGSVYRVVKASGKTELASALSRKGYTFAGWKEQKSTIVYDACAEYDVNEDVVFEAVWEKIPDPVKYKLYFKTSGGTGVKTLELAAGSVVDLSEYKSEKSGHRFIGWYSDSSLKERIYSVELTRDTTVYAGFKKRDNGYTGGSSSEVEYFELTFETRGGTELEPVRKLKNVTVKLSKYIPEREGYIFDGWYTDRKLTNKVESVKMTKNITLWAAWREAEPDEEQNQLYVSRKPEIFTDEHIAFIRGRENGYIFPEDTLTRAEAAQIFYRLLTPEVRESIYSEQNDFDDVSADDWFNVSVSTLVRLGVIRGRDDKSFAPNDSITRAELTTMIARLSETSYDGDDMFDDIAEHWARGYINTAASIGWVKGDNGSFRPDDDITRAEAITLIDRVLERMPESEEAFCEGMMTPPDNTDKTKWYYLAIQEAVNSHDYIRCGDGIFEVWVSCFDEIVD